MRYQPARACLALHFKSVFEKIWIFFCFELICFWCFQIILMCWYQKWFLKNKKNIIGILFWVKSTLKSNHNHNHTPKHNHNHNHTPKHAPWCYSSCWLLWCELGYNTQTSGYSRVHPDIAGCKVGVLVEVWDLNLEMQVTLVFFSVFFFERWTNTEFPCSWS